MVIEEVPGVLLDVSGILQHESWTKISVVLEKGTRRKFSLRMPLGSFIKFQEPMSNWY